MKSLILKLISCSYGWPHSVNILQPCITLDTGMQYRGLQ